MKAEPQPTGERVADDNADLRAEVERARGAAALRESEARLGTELEDARVLQKLSNELVSDGGPDGHFHHIVEVARTLMRSDAASMQELDAADSRLKLIAHTGFHAESAAFWAYVDADVGSSCGRALRAHERVVVPDMDRFEADPQGVAAYRKSGIMSVQSTPLVASNGRIVGMLSTHWNRPHTPSAASYRFFDILARLAADFLERGRVEAARRLAEERLLAASEAARAQVTATLESIGDAFYAVDADFRFTYVNAKAESMWGRRRETLLGKNLWSEFPQAVGGEPHARHLAAMRDRRPAEFEAPSPVLGRWIEASLYPDPASGGLACYFRDITQRRAAEAALRESEERHAFLLKLSDALRAAPDEDAMATVAVELTAAALHVDRSFIAVLMRDENRSVVAHDHRRPDLQSMQGGAPRQWTRAELTLIEEAAERTWAAIERARATERARAEAARTTLFRKLTIAEEEERRRISRELHDGLGQEVTSLLLGLQRLEHDLPEGSPQRQRLREATSIAQAINRDIHDVATALRPAVLDDLGLEEALASLVARWSKQTGTSAQFERVGSAAQRLPPEGETTLYRIVQEALNNAAKHAAARTVSVIVERRPSEVVVFVEDDGRGFDAESDVPGAPGARLGLAGMAERLGLLGGSLAIESSVGRGTTVRARVPLS